MEPLDHLCVEPAPEDAVLQSRAVRLQRLGHAVKGYEQMSVEEILIELGASKGGFYHYFDSKVALLEAVVERMVDAATGTMAPISTDPNLTALQQLEGMFAGLASWKADRKELMLALLRVWFCDDNAIVRDKLRQGMELRLTPLLAGIVRHGMADGLFSASSPDGAARVLVSLLQGANETASHLFLARQAAAVSFEDVELTLAAYAEAYERILGLPAGSWPITDTQTLHLWFD